MPWAATIWSIRRSAHKISSFAACLNPSIDACRLLLALVCPTLRWSCAFLRLHCNSLPGYSVGLSTLQGLFGSCCNGTLGLCTVDDLRLLGLEQCVYGKGWGVLYHLLERTVVVLQSKRLCYLITRSDVTRRVCSLGCFLPGYYRPYCRCDTFTRLGILDRL